MAFCLRLFCLADRRWGEILRLGWDVGNAGDRSTGQGNARGRAARGGTAGGLEPGAGGRGVAGAWPSLAPPPPFPCRVQVASLWPDFNQFSLPGVDRLSLPDFSRFSSPNFHRVAAPPPPSPAPVLVPDEVVRAGLRDIQSSQDQNAAALASLTQSSAIQQADLKRITRQLAVLTAQVNSLQNPVPAPLTTSSIAVPTIAGIPPLTTSSIPRPNPHARLVQASRRVFPPPPAAPSLPKPVGPVSVGGAPLNPPPMRGSDES